MESPALIPNAPLLAWMEALHARHSADLNFRELRRAIQALSDRYVHKRSSLKSGGPLDSKGKRAAFCWFYTLLHFRVVEAALHESALPGCLPRVTDLGGGTGSAAIAARTLGHGAADELIVVDRDPGVLREAAWNAKQLRIQLKGKRGDISAIRGGGTPQLLVAAYSINELEDRARARLLAALPSLLTRGSQLLIVEPISKAVTPWWGSWEKELAPLGARSGSLSLRPDLPETWWEYSRACRLDHQRVKARLMVVG